MALEITKPALQQLKTLWEKEGDPKPYLRILIQHRCHCGNVHFGMGWDDRQEGDWVLEMEGLPIAVDPETYPYLEEAQVDWLDDGVRQGFVLRRPSSGGGCGCGGHG
ncbi:MAG: iron-sulfur cluster assembly accessory protein [Clostridiales bacterium]|nr:iron-sulfur cluster assembly accessory protein [Clostridiales bacterium]